MSKQTWEIDLEHANVKFTIPHMVIGKVVGLIKSFGGTITSQGVDFNDAQVEALLDPSSLDTNNAKRDAHLKSVDFLEVDKYPTIRFVSTHFKRKGERQFEVEGKLTIKNQTHPVTLEATYKGIQKDPWGNIKLGFTATTQIRRVRFGLTWDKPLENGALFIGHEIDIDINAEFYKK